MNVRVRQFLKESSRSQKITNTLSTRIIKILTELVRGENDVDNAVTLLEDVVAKYDLKLANINVDAIKKHLETILNDYIDQEVDFLKEDIYDESEADDKRAEIEDFIERIEYCGIDVHDVYIGQFDDVDWYEAAMNNQMNRALAKND